MKKLFIKDSVEIHDPNIKRSKKEMSKITESKNNNLLNDDVVSLYHVEMETGWHGRSMSVENSNRNNTGSIEFSCGGKKKTWIIIFGQ